MCHFTKSIKDTTIARNMLVHIAFVATLTLWIIRFESADHNPEVVITDSLKTMNIGMFENTSDVSRNQGNFISTLRKYNQTEDPYGILSSEKSKYNISVEKHISDADFNEILKHKDEHTYYEIYFPITKKLFFKVTSLTLKSDVEFTTDEICSVLKHLFIHLDDKFRVSCMIYRNMLENPSLYDQLECKCNEQMDDDTDISLMFSSLMIELANCAVLVMADDYENIAVVSVDNHEEDRFHIHTKLNEMIGLFPIQHLIVDADFISQNNEFLQDLCISNNRKLTVTIEFTAIKYTQRTNDTMKNKLEELSSSTFLQLEYVQIIDIHLSHIIINFDLNFLKNKQVNLVCNNCTLSNGMKLPKMSDKLFLKDCNLNINLNMPGNISTILFRNVTIAEDVSVTVSNNATHLEFINVMGRVHIPNINEDLHIMKYNIYWSFKQIKDANGTIEELLIECAVFEKTNIDFCQKIKKLALKNIDFDEKTIIIIRNSVETVHIEKLSGTIHLYDSIVHSGLLTVKLSSGDLSIQEEVSTQTTDTKYNVNKHKKFILKNANIVNDITLSDDLFEIYFDNVVFSNSQRPLKLKNNICAIHLDSCNGSVSFNNIAGFDQIFFAGNSNQLFIFNKSLQTEKAALRMENILIHGDVTLSQDVCNISFFDITQANNGTLTIYHGYDSLKIVDCQGRYSIPGISQNGQPIIDMPEMQSINIKLKKAAIYDIQIKNMVIEQSWTINFNINDLELHNIRCDNERDSLKFTGSCKDVSLSYISCMISFENVESFNKMVFNSTDCAHGTESVLQIPAQHIELDKTKITADIVLPNQTKYARIESVCDDSVDTLLFTKKILLNSSCKYIYASYNKIAIDMSTIIKRSDNDNVIYAVTPSRFEFVTIDSADFAHLMLKDFWMSENWQIVKEMKSLELEKVLSIDKNNVSTIEITHELNNISLTDCNIDISLSHPCKLKRMSITKSKMIYNPIIHTSVEYISLISTEVDETLVLADSVRVFHIENVCIKGKVVLGQNITSLCIINVIGLIDMSKTVINYAVELKGKEVIQLERTTFGYSLNMKHVCFPNDHHFSSNIQTIKLNNINICNCTIKVSNCHYVEVSNCTSLEIYKSNDEIRGSVEGCETNGLLILSNTHTLKLHNIKLSHSIELPSCIRTIILEKIEMTNSNQFIVNQESEKIYLLSCKGVFDIRRITQLRKLAFVSSMSLCILLKSDNHLNDLHDLEIGGDVDNNFIISVLSQCNNLKRLTLHNPMLSYKHGYDEIYIIYKGDLLPFSVDNNLDFLSKIFSFNMVNKLEYLDISELFVDYAKIKTLKNLKKLQTLIVNSSAVGQISLKNIPRNVEILKYTDNYDISTVNYFSEKFKVNSSEDAKNIKHLTIKNITLDSTLTILYYLPLHLEKLIITTLNLHHYPDKQTSRSKSYVKKLVLQIISIDNDKTIKQKNFARRHYVETFEYLQEFIDFDKLEVLVIETDATRIYLNTKTFQIV